MAYGLRLALLLGVATAAFAGGAGELQDYAPDTAATLVLTGLRACAGRGVSESGSQSGRHAGQGGHPAVARTSRGAARRFRRRTTTYAPRIEYDAYNRLSGHRTVLRQTLWTGALEHVERFAEQKGSVCRRLRTARRHPGTEDRRQPRTSALLHARAAKRATMTALRINPDHQVAHLNLGFTFANTPEAFGGDRKAAARHFRRAFSGSASGATGDCGRVAGASCIISLAILGRRRR